MSKRRSEKSQKSQKSRAGKSVVPAINLKAASNPNARGSSVRFSGESKGSPRSSTMSHESKNREEQRAENPKIIRRNDSS